MKRRWARRGDAMAVDEDGFGLRIIGERLDVFGGAVSAVVVVWSGW